MTDAQWETDALWRLWCIKAAAGRSQYGYRGYRKGTWEYKCYVMAQGAKIAAKRRSKPKGIKRGYATKTWPERYAGMLATVHNQRARNRRSNWQRWADSVCKSAGRRTKRRPDNSQTIA